MFKLLKSTTSMTMCVALALPTGGFAQSSAVVCGAQEGEVVFPCILADGTEVSTADQLRQLTQGVAEQAAEAAEAVTAPLVDTEAEAAADAQAAEAQAEIEAQVAADAAAKSEAAEGSAQEPTAADEPAPTADVAADPAPSTEAETAPVAQAEQATPSEPEKTEEQIAEDLAAQQAAEDARQQQRAAEAAAAAQSAAAIDSGTAEAQVETEEVTAEQTRSSDEEFSTQVTGQATAAAPQEDKGLSKFEKALLLGLGAVAVGAVLKNGSKVVSNSGDRVVVEDSNGDLRVLKDDDALIRQAGDEVRRETFDDGSARTTVTKPDGSQVVTILARDGTVLRRINIDAQGNEYVLFDDTQEERAIRVQDLPAVKQTNTLASQQNQEALRIALETQLRGDQAQRFSLRQVRDIQQVRALAPEVELDAVRFASGSSAIQPEQARSLAKIGTAISEAIRNDPRTVILVEGHTDAVGNAGYNLALSDRRAETVALALTEYFNVPPANLITQGYGETALKVPTLADEPANRRAVVRNITGLLRQ